MDTMILQKSERDGGGFGKFRTMTLEDARALSYDSLIWALGDKGEAQKFAFSGEYTDRDVESMLVEIKEEEAV